VFVLLVEVQVRSEMLEAFETAILENAARSVEREPGCLRFDVSQRLDDPTRWIFHEVYTDEAAHATHRETPHFVAYDEVAGRAVLSKAVTRCTSKRLTP
jgi:autoinducer 2-degrading protein